MMAKFIDTLVDITIAAIASVVILVVGYVAFIAVGVATALFFTWSVLMTAYEYIVKV